MAVYTVDRSTSRPGLSSSGDRFLEFHNRNPHVYEAVVEATRAFRRRTGKKIVSIDYIFGIIRWEMDIEVSGAGQFKFNAMYYSYYARLVMIRNYDLCEVFKMRASEADSYLAANYSRCR